jgi:hypothetical protein
VPANHKKDRRKPGIRPITTARGIHPPKEMMIACIDLLVLWHCTIINSRAKTTWPEVRVHLQSNHHCGLLTVIRKEFTVYE